MINKKYIKYLIAFYYINILRHLFISLKEVHKIPYEDIIYIEAYQHHVMIHQNDMTKRNYLSLKEIALQLDDSFVVVIEAILLI